MIAALLCFVIGITDGDTIKARCGAPGAYQQVTVRLAAIDAPERRQPFGEVSRQHLAALCFNQPARITPRTKDRYGRMVADVSCQGRDAGADMVSASSRTDCFRLGRLIGPTCIKKVESPGCWALNTTNFWRFLVLVVLLMSASSTRPCSRPLLGTVPCAPTSSSARD